MRCHASTTATPSPVPRGGRSAERVVLHAHGRAQSALPRRCPPQSPALPRHLNIAPPTLTHTHPLFPVSVYTNNSMYTLTCMCTPPQVYRALSRLNVSHPVSVRAHITGPRVHRAACVVARKARRFPPPMGSLSASSTFSTVRSLRVYRAAPHRGPNGSQFFTHPLRAHTISIPRSRCPRISFPGFSRSLTDSLSLPLCASLDHPLVLLKQTDTYRQTCSFSRADSFSRPRRISFLPALFPFLISLCFTVSPWRTCHRCAARRLLWVHTFPPL